VLLLTVPAFHLRGWWKRSWSFFCVWPITSCQTDNPLML